MVPLWMPAATTFQPQPACPPFCSEVGAGGLKLAFAYNGRQLQHLDFFVESAEGDLPDGNPGRYIRVRRPAGDTLIKPLLNVTV